MSTAIAWTDSYSGTHANTRWYGRRIDDATEFDSYLKDTVAPRVTDVESDFETALRSLATTGMQTAHVEKLLKAVPKPKGWEIGEALAECLLATDSERRVHWPWNTVRDRRTPRASLPGADLVGFCTHGNVVVLLFGEVKTSSDKKAPPNVMYGGSGMNWQLQETASRLDIHRTLLEWLFFRCTDAQAKALYEQAVRRYLSSNGKELLIVGMLIRDTPPDESDLRGRGKDLAGKLTTMKGVELYAWYLPTEIAKWPALIERATS